MKESFLKVIKRQKQKARAHARNYSFECDWLIELSNNFGKCIGGK